MFLDSCLSVIIENNDINLDTATAIRHYTMGAVKYFNNQTPAGNLIQGALYTKFNSDYGKLIYKDDTFKQSVNELTTDADLGLSLST